MNASPLPQTLDTPGSQLRPRLSGRAFTGAFVTLLAAALAVAYAGSVRVGFEFDDWHTLQNNPAIRSLRNIPRFFVDPSTMTVLRENTDVRPFLTTTFAINYALSGAEPWSYHVVNVLIHFLAALLVFVLVRDTVWWPATERGPEGAARRPAAAAALFFALAPLNSDSVLYLSSRSALLTTTLYLGAFLCYRQRRWALLTLLYACALTTKAIAVTLPATILAYDFLYRDRRVHPTVSAYLRDGRRLLLPVGLPAALNVLYLIYRHVSLGSLHLASYAQPFATTKIWLMSQWSAHLYYVRLFVWPDALSVDHDFPYAFHFSDFRAWGALAVIVAWIGLALWSSRRTPIVAFATAWFFLTLAPESSLLPLAEVVNDHRPYIASALGLSVLVAWLLHQAAVRFARQPLPAFAAATLAIAAASVAVTRHRTWQWQDSLRLWQDAVDKGPGNGRAWMNAGRMHLQRGNLAEARRYFEEARRLLPSYAFVYMNLSALARQEGRGADALRDADEAVRLSPSLGLTHYFRGAALEGLGRGDEAAAAYLRATELSPGDPGPRRALERHPSPDPDVLEMNEGVQALHVERDAARAETHFRNVLARNASHYGARYQLAVALDHLGRASEARAMWDRVQAAAAEAGDRTTLETARARLAARP